MANIPVIKTIEESYELIRAHWREVMVPLVLLILLSGAGNMGGNSYSGGNSRDYSSSSSSSGLDSAAQTDFLTANALAGADAALLGLGVFLLVIIVFAIIFIILISILNQATWLHIYEHFYCLLTGAPLPSDWQARFKRHAFKAAALLIFSTSLFMLFIAVPAAIAFTMPGFIPAGAFSLSAFFPIIGLFLSFLLLLFIANFFLSALWIYYAMDLLPFWESVRRSIGLIGGNLFTFVKFFGCFIVIGVAAGISILLTCCFAFITMPVVQVFLALLSGVTMMNLKLKIEGKTSPIATRAAAAKPLKKKPAKKK